MNSVLSVVGGDDASAEKDIWFSLNVVQFSAVLWLFYEVKYVLCQIKFDFAPVNFCFTFLVAARGVSNGISFESFYFSFVRFN